MHSAAAHPSAPRSSSLPRFARSFRARIGAALALIAAGDLLFFRHGTGATLGLFALVVLTAMATTRPAILRNAAPRAAAAAALVFAAALADDPSLLAAGLLALRARHKESYRRLGKAGVVAVFEAVEDVAVKNKERQHGVPAAQGGRKAGVVFEPQVAPEPEDGNVGRCFHSDQQ